MRRFLKVTYYRVVDVPTNHNVGERLQLGSESEPSLCAGVGTTSKLLFTKHDLPVRVSHSTSSELGTQARTCWPGPTREIVLVTIAVSLIILAPSSCDGHLTLLNIIWGHQAGDEKVRDEVLHLAAALQFAGARNVVETMWSVDDEAVTLIVEAFYRAMVNEEGVFDPSRAARALRAATRATKDHIPVDQRMVFIHIGV